MKTNNYKSYLTMLDYDTYEERLEYLFIGNSIGAQTFGSERILNQKLYKSSEWKRVRDRVIIRDMGCDLGVDGLELRRGDVIIHHINPITADDILNRNPLVFSMDNLVCVSRSSHNYIHFGLTKSDKLYTERTANDTSPWKVERR